MLIKPNALVYIRRSSLLVAGKHVKPARLTFESDAIINLDIVDPEIFGTKCQTFFEQNNLKGQRVLVVLDHSVVFTKTIALDSNNTKPSQLVSDFSALVPFNPGHRACQSLKSTDGLRIFATNSDFYQLVSEALHRANVSKVVAITPAAAYGIREAQLSTSMVDMLLHDTATTTKTNFLNSKPV